MPYKDPEKRRAYQRRYMQAWYKENSKTQVQRNLDRRKRIQTWFAELKATLCCSHCGENHPACLEFHHENPREKEITLNAAIWKQHWGKARILSEASKCVVLCANCHRKHHWDDSISPETTLNNDSHP
ncbi:MAG: hypothetical protein K2R98_25260 [Gemmataceae bacterium]|nr:hypothetical protein [Gemmataceae bacterium]